MLNRIYSSGLTGLVACGLFACVVLIQPLVPAGAEAAQDTGDARRFGNHNHNPNQGQFCTKTANLQLAACRNEVEDDFFTQSAVCIQIPDAAERNECFDDAADSRKEGKKECGDQLDARKELCDAVGEDRYDPDFEPDSFDDDFTMLTSPNPYYPLGIGNVWEYESEDEVNRVEVLNETKLIDGVTCIVVNDLVENEDGSMEDTNDWIGQRKDGTVVYCGEESKDYEMFPGDMPQLPELVSIEGSFKAGRDGDLPGTLFLPMPDVGDTYRQEFSAGNAEDAATVLSTSYSYDNGEDLDDFVPEDLANLLCGDNSDCVVTAEFTPIEPGVLERKYYAKDIGLFLEVNPESGEINQLVSCSFGGKCDDL
jgi:hypothetical protein